MRFRACEDGHTWQPRGRDTFCPVALPTERGRAARAVCTPSRQRRSHYRKIARSPALRLPSRASTHSPHSSPTIPHCSHAAAALSPKLLGAEYGGHDLLVLNSRDGTPYACPFEPITLPLGGVAAQSHAYLGGGATKRSGEVTLTLPREEGEWSVRLLRLTRNDSHFATTTSIEGCSDLRWPWWDAANATTMVYDLVASFGT